MIRVAKAIPFVLIALLVGAAPLFAQSDWSAVRPTPMVTLQIRMLVGLLMLVPAVTLFLLYLFRPRPYVLAGRHVLARRQRHDAGAQFRFGRAESDAPVLSTCR